MGFALFPIEKIRLLESKLKNDEDEFRRKDKIISELEAQLEATKFINNHQTQIEEISRQALNIYMFFISKIKLQFQMRIFLITLSS